jgi:hypothetical protein
MTGFGERRPILPKEGETVEETSRLERRVALVVYPGATFFAKDKEAQVVTKLDRGKVEVRKKAPEITPLPQLPDKVKGEDELPERAEIVVAARSFRKVIFPADFFDEDDLLLDETRPIVAKILSEVKNEEIWLFVGAVMENLGRGTIDYTNKSVRRQLSLAVEMVGYHGVDADRLFIKDIFGQGVISIDYEGEEGEVYLYIPYK